MIALLTLGLVLSVGSDASLSSTTTLPVLRLEEAVKEALAAHPSLRQARAEVLSTDAKAEQARAALLPQLTATLGYQRGTANTYPRTAVNAPVGTWDTYDFYSGSLTASQLLFDFGNTWNRWQASRAAALAQQSTEATTKRAVALNAYTAYFAAATTKALLAVAEETLANQTRHLDQVTSYVTVGTRPKIDLVQARASLATFLVQRIQADNAYRTAKLQLTLTMGRARLDDFDVTDAVLDPVAGEDGPASPLVDEALAARPELVAASEQTRAQQLRIDGLKRSYLPSLGVATSAAYGGARVDQLGWNWSAQATLTWQLYQGGLTQAEVSEATATLITVEAQREELRHQITLQLEQARLAVVAAKASLDASQQALDNAKERLTLAEARYRTGVGSIIELGDAQLAESNAAAQRVQANHSLATARVQLLSALGRL